MNKKRTFNTDLPFIAIIYTVTKINMQKYPTENQCEGIFF